LSATKLLLLPLLLLSVTVFAQKKVNIRGMALDSAGTTLPGATIKAMNTKDSVFAFTDKDGKLELSITPVFPIDITITLVGYIPYTKKITSMPIGEDGIQLDSIIMETDVALLPGVEVTSVQPIVVKEDTIEYNAKAYKVEAGAPVEDAIKKMPGLEVGKDGAITAQGKAVSRVRVNGKDFFGGDVQTATRNLPADIIENIQIIDDYGDEANLTGIKTGEPEKIININIQKNKNRGVFGNGSVSAGDKGRFGSGISANLFRDETQVNFLGSINNTNADLFNFNGGGRGGGARGNNNFGNESRGGGGGNGITLSQSAGLNVRTNIGKKVSVNGSYSFSARHLNAESHSFRQDLNPLNVVKTTSDNNSHNSSYNHRITADIEYRMDSMNYFKLTPYLSLSKSSSESMGTSNVSRQFYNTDNKFQSAGNSTSPNGGGNLMYHHAFRKKGRSINISTGLNISYSKQERESLNDYHNVDLDSVTGEIIRAVDTIQSQQTFTENKNTSTNINLSYNEPLNKRKTVFLELGYRWNQSNTENVREVDDIDPMTNIATPNIEQTNYFDYKFTTHRAGINLKGREAKYNYTVGLVVQPSVLVGQSLGKEMSTNYKNLNWIPTARFVYNFARNNSLTVTYDGSSREPGFNQLQPVYDSSNLNNVSVGNPNLQAEFTSRFGLNYNKFDNKAGTSLFANLNFDQTQDKIVTSRVNNKVGTGRTTSYINTNGFYNLNGNAAYTKPFNNRKYSVTLGVNGNFSNNITFVDGMRNNGNTWRLAPRTSFRLDLPNIIDVSANVNYSFQQIITRYDTGGKRVNDNETLQLGLSGKNYIKKQWIFGYDVSKMMNFGLQNSVNANPLIINLSAEYRFLKQQMAAVRFQAFDLLNENADIRRTINGDITTDSRTNRLARYFLLTLNLRLQKFSGSGRGNNNQDRRGEGMRQGGGNRGGGGNGGGGGGGGRGNRP
jgi:hypothetical protein